MLPDHNKARAWRIAFIISVCFAWLFFGTNYVLCFVGMCSLCVSWLLLALCEWCWSMRTVFCLFACIALASSDLKRNVKISKSMRHRGKHGQYTYSVAYASNESVL